MEFIFELLNGIFAVLVHDWAVDLSRLNGLDAELFGGERSFAWVCISTIIFFLIGKQSREWMADLKETSWKRKIEGWWVEDININTKDHLSLFRLSRPARMREFALHGHTFLNNGTTFPLFSEWHSLTVCFPENQARDMFYIYQSTIHEDASETIVFGLAHLTFYESAGRKGGIFEGDGYLYDSYPGAREVRFKLHRVTRKMVKDCIGQKEFRSAEDRTRFLRARVALRARMAS